MSEEWGPWIEHDGKGCPCVGCVVYVLIGPLDRSDPKDDDGPWDEGWTGVSRSEGVGIAQEGSCWTWGSGNSYPVIWFRIRKPHGLTILEGLLENLPDEVDA